MLSPRGAIFTNSRQLVEQVLACFAASLGQTTPGRIIQPRGSSSATSDGKESLVTMEPVSSFAPDGSGSKFRSGRSQFWVVVGNSMVLSISAAVYLALCGLVFCSPARFLVNPLENVPLVLTLYCPTILLWQRPCLLIRSVWIKRRRSFLCEPILLLGFWAPIQPIYRPAPTSLQEGRSRSRAVA